MTFRNILLVVGAIFVFAGLGFFITWFGQMNNHPVGVETPAQHPAENRQAVLVAARAIPKGEFLRQQDFKSKDLGPDEVPQPGSLVPGQEKDFLNALIRRDFAEDEPLIASEFVKPDDRNFLAAVLKPGTRAVTIFVDAAQSVAGLAFPGDLVDVLLTLSFDEKDSVTMTTNTPSGNATVTADKFFLPLGKRTAAETVLRGVKVIAVNQSLRPQPNIPAVLSATCAEGCIPKTVTLEVGEQNAEKLLVAEKLGSFQLAVRPLEAGATDLADYKRNAKPVWASDVSQAIRTFSALRSPLAAAAPPTPQVSVHVYSGRSGGDGYLCSKSACVRSDVNTVTPEAASLTPQNRTHAIPTELR